VDRFQAVEGVQMSVRTPKPDEAARFYRSLTPDYDTMRALRWSFLLEGATQDQVGPLMGRVRGMGFTEVEPMADEERDGRYILWFAEVRVHTAESFAERVAAVEHLAAQEGLVVSDYSAGRDTSREFR
jgi:hypothetical protein